jgi:glycosyltransferase involved in cell wall biosynthesis
MLVFFNSILSTSDMLSGGAQIAVDYLKGKDGLTVVMPASNSGLVSKELKANYLFWHLPKDRNNPFLIIYNWALAACYSCKIKINEDVFTSTDNFCNTIPAYKIKGSNKWTACIFHVIPLKWGRIIPVLLQRLSFGLIKKRADKIMVLNELTKAELIKMGFNENRIEVMDVTVDVGHIQSIKQDEKKFSACFMGRLSPSKGIFDLPKIWEGMPGDLLVIGGGGFKEDVEKWKKSCQGKNIVWVGPQYGDSKYRFMKSSKVFIFPSYEEGLSLTIMEALACDLPVIAWDLPVYKTVFQDRIITVPIGNIEMFRRKIREALK